MSITVKQQATQAAFEAWAKDNGLSVVKENPRMSKDTYFVPDTELSWKAWQGAFSEIDNLAALVRQLSYSLSRAKPDSELPARAVDYLKRKDLLGSPLRSAEDVNDSEEIKES